MIVNGDFKQRAAVHAASLPWTPSPMKGVDRRMLDRVGAEVARATSIVRYAPGSAFSPHTHGGGEEFFVLDGVFEDEHGAYPAGMYVRNPPGTSHTPASKIGCTMLVKLHQFDLTDSTLVRLDSHSVASIDPPGRPGVSVLPLYADTRETVRLETWSPRTNIDLLPKGGWEAFVISGSFTQDGETFLAQSWLRLPDGYLLNVTAGPTGCHVLVKEGHLRHASSSLS